MAGAAAAQEKEPLYYAFAKYFDARDSIHLVGTVVSAEWLEPKSVVWVKGSADGGPEKLWRVDTSAGSLFPDSEKAMLSPGAKLTIRGFNTKDKSCAVTCRMAPVEFDMADGQRFLGHPGWGKCTVEQLTKETCPDAKRPGPPPAVN